MLADVMPNILALAPYESVYGLVCSCRALSRLPIKRDQYEIEAPIDLGDKSTGVMTRYPNGWRLRMRACDSGASVNAAYLNNMPIAAYVNTDAGALAIISLVTGVCCVMRAEYIGVGGAGLSAIAITPDHVAGDQDISKEIVMEIVAILRPLLMMEGDTSSIMCAVTKAIDLYARRVGSANDTMMSAFGDALCDVLHERLRWN